MDLIELTPAPPVSAGDTDTAARMNRAAFLRRAALVTGSLVIAQSLRPSQLTSSALEQYPDYLTARAQGLYGSTFTERCYEVLVPEFIRDLQTLTHRPVTQVAPSLPVAALLRGLATDTIDVGRWTTTPYADAITKIPREHTATELRQGRLCHNFTEMRRLAAQYRSVLSYARGSDEILSKERVRFDYFPPLTEYMDQADGRYLLNRICASALPAVAISIAQDQSGNRIALIEAHDTVAD
jgi:hypothetical protein